MTQEGRIGSMIHFVLPLEPVAWERVKRGRNGQAYVPAKTRRFKHDAAMLITRKWHERPLESPLRLTAKFILKAPKRPKWERPGVRPDLDNYVKAVKDALNGILWADDSLIVEYGTGTGKYYAPKDLRPMILIWVEVL